MNVKIKQEENGEYFVIKCKNKIKMKYNKK